MLELQSAATAGTRRVIVRHATRYQYDRPITRSQHRIHLRPAHDWKQNVRSFRLQITPEVPLIEYEDVFGNWTARFEINQPYSELSMVAESEIDLLDVDPFAFAGQPIRPPFPLSWMPWEQKMLVPYLTPIELPETQLTELYDYAMSYVERNQRDLMETLFDINLSLFREFKYLPGSTTVETTPFEVMTQKQGVCQDFANLFICLARLLGIPARYVCGYVYTGHEDSPMGDASHAWVQLYIPSIGWKGFDPTNGKLPTTDHVRVAVGRHYRDTAPATGTLYSSGAETMSVEVKVHDLTGNHNGSSQATENSGPPQQNMPLTNTPQTAPAV